MRPTIRRIRGINNAWVRSSVQHDFATGVALPSYFGMLYSFVQPDIIQQLDHHVLALAGAIAIGAFLTELFGDTGSHGER